MKEAFGIAGLTNVEQYLQAEMLSLIVPLALGYLAVRAVASGLSGAAESGRLDPDLSAVRYASVFRYYGNAIEDGIDPLAFAGVTVVAVALAALGAWLFDRRDLAA